MAAEAVILALALYAIVAIAIGLEAERNGGLAIFWPIAFVLAAFDAFVAFVAAWLSTEPPKS